MCGSYYRRSNKPPMHAHAALQNGRLLSMPQIEIDIFKRPDKYLIQCANPPQPRPVFIACVAVIGSAYILRNFRADDLSGIISQLAPILDSDVEDLSKWFTEHKTWFAVRDVSEA